jgi:hypothetical protein
MTCFNFILLLVLKASILWLKKITETVVEMPRRVCLGLGGINGAMAG